MAHTANPFPEQRQEPSVGGREVASNFYWIDLGFVNVYLVGQPDGRWAIIDTGAAFHFEAVRKVAAERFGKEARPEAIYLTHGHSDHAGAALALAAYYDVPIYVHPAELPFVTGRSLYPPLDPTVGGAFGFLSRFFTNAPQDLGRWVQALPENDLPGLEGWQSVAIPGHTPGQVAFFREADRVVIAGDACSTVNLDRWDDLVRRRKSIAIPPPPATTDWVAARKSCKRLAALTPRVLACGHGVPLTDEQVAVNLFAFSEHFIAPLRGRYVSDPALFDTNGILYLPPRPQDPLPKAMALMGVSVLVGVLWYNNKRRSDINRG